MNSTLELFLNQNNKALALLDKLRVIVKCIAVLPNGNELKMEKLAGEKLPQIGEQIYPCWNPGDAVLIHSQSHIVYQAMENVVLK